VTCARELLRKTGVEHGRSVPAPGSRSGRASVAPDELVHGFPASAPLGRLLEISTAKEVRRQIDPRRLSPLAVYKLLIGCIVPRPIAWVSTVSADGIYNLAPFSFFMGVCPDPPTLAFSVGPRGPEGHGAESRGDR
jgi:hypothetical protein